MLTPEELAKSNTEHAHQRALFAYTNVVTLYGWAIANDWARGLVTFSKGKIFFPKVCDYLKESKPCPKLKWFHAIHNQGHGDRVRGNRAKVEGVKSGVYDCFLPVPVWSGPKRHDWVEYHGLYLEMKKPSVKPKSATAKGGRSDDQIEFGEFAEEQGYATVVCYSWFEAAEALWYYLENTSEFSNKYGG